MSAVTPASLAHSPAENVLALAIGTLFAALGVMMLKTAGLAVGGTAGIAFLAHFGLGASFPLVFFFVNLPFFVLAHRVFGPGYVVRSIIATGGLSLLIWILPPVFSIGHIEPAFAAVAGGLLIGMGMLALVRHRTGIGGIAIVATLVQQRHGIRAGYTLMAVDAAVVAAALAIMDPAAVLFSMLACVSMNVVLALYHKAGRYQGF